MQRPNDKNSRNDPSKTFFYYFAEDNRYFARGMKPLPLLLILPLLYLGTGCTARVDRHEQALEELDRVIEQRDAYNRMKARRVEGRLREFDATQNIDRRIGILSDIYHEYLNFNVDSAYRYAHRMLTLAERHGRADAADNARIYLARTLYDGGMYGEAGRILRQVDTADRARRDMFSYYGLYRSLLRNLRDAAPRAQHARYNDSIRRYDLLYTESMAEGTLSRKRRDANALNSAGKPEEALALLLPEYEAGVDDVHQRAMIAYALSNIYKRLGDADRRKAYLIRASIDDLRTPVREGLALYNLATLLFEEGDVARANRYINASMEDALYCNFRARTQQSSEMVQQIAHAYIDSLDAKRRAMNYVAIAVSLLVVVLLGSFFVILGYYRKIRQISASRLEMNRQLQQFNRDIEQQNRHIRRINGELRDANSIKDEYVGHYLNLCSRYILKINAYRKYLLKVSKDAGLAAMLREMRAKNPSDAEYKEFLAMFDETFLHLFPDFVAQVNELMEASGRFALRQPQTLNTELRILALIRLGVARSTEIAAILNCSVATIHTYRAQLRNAALGDRSTFDDAIRRIGIPGAEAAPHA